MKKAVPPIDGSAPERQYKDEELVQIAKDLLEGRIFTDRNLEPGDARMLGSIFLPLALMDEAQAKKMMADRVSMVFEYLNKAGPRGINGYPFFTSCRVMNCSDFEKFAEIYNKAVAIQKEADEKMRSIIKY